MASLPQNGGEDWRQFSALQPFLQELYGILKLWWFFRSTASFWRGVQSHRPSLPARWHEKWNMTISTWVYFTFSSKYFYLVPWVRTVWVKGCVCLCVCVYMCVCVCVCESWGRKTAPKVVVERPTLGEGRLDCAFAASLSFGGDAVTSKYKPSVRVSPFLSSQTWLESPVWVPEYFGREQGRNELRAGVGAKEAHQHVNSLSYKAHEVLLALWDAHFLIPQTHLRDWHSSSRGLDG